MTVYNKKRDVVVEMIRQQMSYNDYTISDISNKTGIARSQIHNWLNGTAKTIRDSSLGKVAEKLNYKLHTTDQGIKLRYVKDKGNEESMINQMQQQITELQSEKIKWLEDKIASLENNINNNSISLINSNIPNWNTVEFDIRTTQSYEPVNCLFSKYKMDDYVKFFNYLGYNPSEAQIIWENHRNYMTSTKTYEKEEFMKNTPFVDVIETDELIADQFSTIKFFESNIKANIVSVIQVAKCVYIHKNGSHVLASITVLFDIINYHSESKIKFLNINN
jgi:transcriptional regulator with XRE-family HTH domain